MLCCERSPHNIIVCILSQDIGRKGALLWTLFESGSNPRLAAMVMCLLQSLLKLIIDLLYVQTYIVLCKERCTIRESRPFYKRVVKRQAGRSGHDRVLTWALANSMTNMPVLQELTEREPLRYLNVALNDSARKRWLK